MALEEHWQRLALLPIGVDAPAAQNIANKIQTKLNSRSNAQKLSKV